MPKKETSTIEYRGYNLVVTERSPGWWVHIYPPTTDYCIRIPIMSQDLRRRRRSRKPVQLWTVAFRLETARWRSRRTHPPQPPAPTAAVRALYGETTVKSLGNSWLESARCGNASPPLCTVTVFASAAHVATTRMLADNIRSVLDKLSVMMRSLVEGAAFFGHTFRQARSSCANT